jgi:CheY-like chemotaxis protein
MHAEATKRPAPRALAPQDDRGGLPAFDTLPAERRTVLVADDDVGYRAALSTLLQARGFTVDQAGDGQEALDRALADPPWLVLSDVQMPRLDGLTLCRRLKRHNLLCTTPVVMITGADELAHLASAGAAGADDCLPKRMPLREFLLRVRLVMDRYGDAVGPREPRPDLAGRIGILGATGLLQTIHLASLTGRLLAAHGGRRIGIGWREGEIVSADCQLSRGLPALVGFASWPDGRFEFTAGDPGEGTPVSARCFEWLMLEICRLVDELGRI